MIKFARRHSLALLLVGLLLLAYGRFLWPSTISQGDWFYPLPDRSYFWSGSMSYLSPLNLNAFLSYGLVGAPLSNLAHYLIGGQGFSVAAVNALLYFWPAVFVMAIGMWLLASRIDRSMFYRFWATLLFSVNGFVLTLLIGGQLTGAIAYGLVALILYLYDLVIKREGAKPVIPLALALYVQSIFEIRYLFITALAVLFWSFGRGLSNIWAARRSIGFTLAIFTLLSFFWVYALFFLGGTNLAPEGYTGLHWIKTLSYANWVDALSLRHVWWPAIGAKTPTGQFVYLLIIPFISLFALKTNRRFSLALWLLALTGAYLVNGLHGGEHSLYVWLYQTILGPLGFRDPAKFFTLVAVAEALLFASGLRYLQQRYKTGTQWIALAVSIVFLIAYWPLWSQRTGGTFVKTSRSFTAVNSRLAEIDQDSNWGRILWLPTTYRYALSRLTLPFLMSDDTTINRLRERVGGLDGWLSGEDVKVALPYMYRSLGSEYLAIPGDVTGEIFERNYAHSSESYLNRVKLVDPSLIGEVVIDEAGKSTYLLKVTGSTKRAYQSDKTVITDDASAVVSLFPSQNPTSGQLIWREDVESSPKAKDIIERADAFWLQTEIEATNEDIVISVRINPGQYSLWLPNDFNWLVRAPNKAMLTDGRRVIDGRVYRQYSVEMATGVLEVGLPISAVVDSYGLKVTNDAEDCASLGATSLSGETLRGVCRLNRYPHQSGLLLTKLGDQNKEIWVNFHPIKDYRLANKPGWLMLSSPDEESDIRLVSQYDVEGVALLPKNILPKALLIERPTENEAVAPAIRTMGDNFNGLKVDVDARKKGFWLTVNNEFNPNWQMTNDRGEILLHTKSLLYQNMWYVPAGESERLMVVFTPDRAIRTWMSISNWSIVFLLAAWCAQKWIQRPKVSAM